METNETKETCYTCEKVISGDECETLSGENVCFPCFKQNAAQCHECGDNVDKATIETRGEHGQKIELCETCASDFITCCNCHKPEKENVSQSFENEWYCEDCAGDILGYCEDCQETCLSENMQSVNGGDRYICQSCFDDSYFSCDHCGDIGHNDNQYSSENHTYCEGCYSDNCSTCEDCGETTENDNGGYNEAREVWLCDSCGENQNTFEQSPTFNVNQSRRFIGYELEYVADSAINCGEYGALHGDGSVSPNEEQSGKNAYEFSSIAMNGDKLFQSIDKVTKAIQSNGGAVNKTCGFHVHVDMRDMTGEARENIFYAFQAYEKIFLAIVSPSRRVNTYCKSIDGFEFSNSKNDRYKTLNICSLQEHETFEFRLHQGTIDAGKIKNFITLLINFCETFKNVEMTQERRETIQAMNDREKLLLLFSMVKLPLSIKRYMVARIKKLAATFYNLKSIDAKQLPLNLPHVESENSFNEANDMQSETLAYQERMRELTGATIQTESGA